MKSNNFIYFLSVFGFFIGLLFTILKVEDPFMVIFYTIVITISFYTIGILSTSFFIQFVKYDGGFIDKKGYDNIYDIIDEQINDRELKAEEIYGFIHELVENDGKILKNKL